MKNAIAQLPQLILTIAVVLSIPALAHGNTETDWQEYDVSLNDEETNGTLQETDLAPAQTSSTPFRRRIMREDITIRIKTLRLDSGGKVKFIYGAPKGARNAPAVFVLDVESTTLATSPGRNLPGITPAKWKEIKQASYLLKSPFGSNMLGNGFAVAYIVADDLETLRSARTPDWVGIFNRVRDLRHTDPNNVFLFSTREYANLSLYLATRYKFSGFILEEPSYLLFTSRTYEDVIDKIDRLTSEEIWQKTDPTREFMYEQVLGEISTPMMLIRNPASKAYSLNEKTLIPKLEAANAAFETIEVAGFGRGITVFGGNERSGVLDVTPQIAYDVTTVSKWVDEILTYMRINSSVDPIALRDPSDFRNW